MVGKLPPHPRPISTPIPPLLPPPLLPRELLEYRMNLQLLEETATWPCLVLGVWVSGPTALQFYSAEGMRATQLTR